MSAKPPKDQIKKPRKKEKPKVHYTPELGIKICEAIANSSHGLDLICKQNENFPTGQAIRLWLLNNSHPEFTENYAKAKREQAHIMVDQILYIADALATQTITDENGRKIKIVPKREEVEAAKLRVDARKWVASKLFPRIYGDKIEVEKPPENNNAERYVTDEQRIERIVGVLKTARERADTKGNKRPR